MACSCILVERHNRHSFGCACLTLAAAEEELRERELFLARQEQQRLELQQQLAANLLPDPLQAVSDVVSAYTAEQGFKEMSVQDLSVAVTAGGLIDLVLDVRSHQEFAAGGCSCHR